MPVKVHGLDEVARLDRDPAGLTLQALVVRHAGVDADEDLLNVVQGSLGGPNDPCPSDLGSIGLRVYTLTVGNCLKEPWLQYYIP